MIKIKHIITLKGYTVNVWIRACPLCNRPTTIMMGKTSIKCIDCLKKEENSERHIPIPVRIYTSLRLIRMIREERVGKIKVKRNNNNIWEDIIPKKTEDYVDKFYY